ncbi:MAG: hypothetical protein LC772_09045 [Chloroflexi bacterium]|nr:hypothetical protein [Chloroflexota bacterium]
MPTEPIRLYWKSTCSKCRRAIELLHGLNVPLVEREYSGSPLTEAEIREIAGPRPIAELLNPAREAFKELGFDQRTPDDAEALAALASETNLLYRPIAIRGDRMVKGFQEEELRALAADD